MSQHRPQLSRRDVLRLAASCGGYLALLRHADPLRARRIQAAASFRLPDEIADWVLFSPSYFQVAFSRWRLELGS
jgi:hypothetical protein